MRTVARVVLGLALASGIVCIVTGLPYFALGEDLPAGMQGWLGTLALLGGSALGASGLWQERADPVVRPLALVVVTALAAGYVAANVLALLGAVPDGLPAALKALHVAGATVGATLYGAALIAATNAFGARRHEGGPNGDARSGR